MTRGFDVLIEGQCLNQLSRVQVDDQLLVCLELSCCLFKDQDIDIKDGLILNISATMVVTFIFIYYYYLVKVISLKIKNYNINVDIDIEIAMFMDVIVIDFIVYKA